MWKSVPDALSARLEDALKKGDNAIEEFIETERGKRYIANLSYAMVLGRCSKLHHARDISAPELPSWLKFKRLNDLRDIPSWSDVGVSRSSGNTRRIASSIVRLRAIVDT